VFFIWGVMMGMIVVCDVWYSNKYVFRTIYIYIEHPQSFEKYVTAGLDHFLSLYG
jgi:hypothetical protein